MFRVRYVALIAAFLTSFSSVHALDYPSRPIKLVVPLPAGGSADAVARLLAEHLRATWKQTIVVENRPGANTAIGTTAVVRSAPDGYTLLFGVPSLSTFKAMVDSPGVDVEKDLAAISQVMVGPYVLAVNARLPVRTATELIAYAKANPGKLNYEAHAGGQTLAVELFSQKADIELFRVPYQGEMQGVAALVANDVQVAWASPTTLKPFIDSGAVRAIGVSTATERFPSMPDVPTINESGLPGYNPSVWFGVLAPAATPVDIQNKIGAAIAGFVTQPEVIVRSQALGFVPKASTPQEFSKFISEEIRTWRQVAKTAGLGPQ